MLRCTSSPFTKSVVWERLRDVVLTRLADPALYDVSVRSLAVLTRIGPGGDKQTRRLRTHSQASSPRSVALPQLPSSSTSPSEQIIWYTALQKFPVSYRGLSPHNNHAHAGRTQSDATDRNGRSGFVVKSKSIAPIPAVDLGRYAAAKLTHMIRWGAHWCAFVFEVFLGTYLGVGR